MKIAPVDLDNHKIKRYMKAIQFFMFSASLLMTLALFIGAFFNPAHIVTTAMSAVMSLVIYREKRW